MWTIENHVSVPRRGRRESYPFYDMRIGDSFFIEDAQNVKNARSAAWVFSKRHPGVKFSCRKSEGGWRLWRIA